MVDKMLKKPKTVRYKVALFYTLVPRTGAGQTRKCKDGGLQVNDDG